MKTIAFFTALLCATPTLADSVFWKDVQGWTIKAYDFDEGCSAFTEFESGTEFYIGFDLTGSPMLEVLLFNDAWASIKPGKAYEIGLVFGDETGWTLDMTGLNSDGNTPGLSIDIDLSDDRSSLFMEEFMRETRMRWTFDGTQLGNLSLRGSRAALNEAVACTKSYNDAIASSDPFAGKAGDVFAR